jgi:hypothetical protein
MVAASKESFHNNMDEKIGSFDTATNNIIYIYFYFILKIYVI